MNELNLANVVEVVPEVEVDATKTPPSGSYMIKANKCSYHFKITMQRKPESDDQASSGTLTLVLANTFTIDENSIDTQSPGGFDPDTRVWTFGPINNGNRARTLAFDATYEGPAGAQIVTSANFTVQVPSVGDVGGTATAEEGSVSTTVEACQPPTRMPPTVTLTVTPVPGQNCKYLFTLTATKGAGDLSGINVGNASFTLPAVFTNLTETPASPRLDLVANPKTWRFDPLPAVPASNVRTATFTADYIGDGSVLASPLLTGTFTGNYTIGGGAFPQGDIGTHQFTPVQNCQPKIPCCEECDGGESGPIDICPCEQGVTIPVDVAVKPNGRTLFVNLNVPRVCKQSDVNVAVYLFERIYSDEGRTTYTDELFAVRVVRLEANCQDDSRTGDDDDHPCCGCEDRACGCVEFDIDDDDDTKCKTRTFIVKTKAHHVFSETPPMCSCDCSYRS